jgi:hypothetical protein
MVPASDLGSIFDARCVTFKWSAGDYSIYLKVSEMHFCRNLSVTRRELEPVTLCSKHLAPRKKQGLAKHK